jgi:hypothetical protein
MRILWPVHTLVGVCLLLVTASGGAAPGAARHTPIPTSISFWNARDGAAALTDWGRCSGRTYFCRGAIAVTTTAVAAGRRIGAVLPSGRSLSFAARVVPGRRRAGGDLWYEASLAVPHPAAA